MKTLQANNRRYFQECRIPSFAELPANSTTFTFTLWGTNFHEMGSNFRLMRKPTGLDSA